MGQRDRLIERMNILHDKIYQRRAMVERLSYLGCEFPDADLQGRFKALKAEARRRDVVDMVRYDELEKEFELLGGNDPDEEYQAVRA